MNGGEPCDSASHLSGSACRHGHIEQHREPTTTSPVPAPFPWDRLDELDELDELDGADLGGDGAFLADVRSLVDLRRENATLQSGSMRWLDATAESVTFARENDTEVVVVHLVRAPMPELTLSARDIGVTIDRDRDPHRSDDCLFGAPFDVAFPDTVILPGDPGASIVSFPKPVPT